VIDNIDAVEKRLWTAADQLRANSDFASNEYFLPVMGLSSCAMPIAGI
jgi:type I restriction enzyme M protein